MKTCLLILGNDPEFGKGQYNKALHETAIDTLSKGYNVLTTDIADGWDIEQEGKKFISADVIIFQYPIFWFTVPALLKKYIDAVYAFKSFYLMAEPYGSGGLLSGSFMLSTTWNAKTGLFEEKDTFFNGHSVDEVNLPMRKTQQYIGLSELPHFSCHDVDDNPEIETNQARYVKHLKRAFPDIE